MADTAPLKRPKIKVFALVGESGTGKSFHAKPVAQRYGIDLIIDDGLLILGNRILAGRSAKEEKTFLAAVKTALFDSKAQRDDVARRLTAEKAKKILVLGTSEKMVRKIAARLQLPPPAKIIFIEDIASQDDIEKAIRARRIEGKHVIPVPSTEVKRNYSNIFYDTIRILSRNKAPIPLPVVPRVHEKSLVRPFYSKTERVIISGFALSQMATQCIEDLNDNIKVKKINVKSVESGYSLIITIDLPAGTQVDSGVERVKSYIVENIEHFTGILIEEVNIVIDKIA
jgi:adenylate kinase family enzyme